MDIIVLKGMLTGFLLSLPFGPIGIYCMEKTLVEGEKEGYFSALGMVTVDVIYGLIAYMGLSRVENIVVKYEVLLRIAMGAALIGLGYRKYKSKVNIRKIENEGEGIIKNYFTCFLVTLANPATLFSFVAIFAALGIVDDPSSHIPQKLGIGIFVGGATMWFIITYILYHWRKVIGVKTLAKITKSCGLIILGFGILTIMSLVI